MTSTAKPARTIYYDEQSQTVLRLTKPEMWQHLTANEQALVTANAALVAALRELIEHAHHPDRSKAAARLEQAEAALREAE